MTKRHKKPRDQDGFRVCAACGVDHGREGPRPAESVIRLIDGELVYACSASCDGKIVELAREARR